jgi:hypothetical protein
MPYILYKDIDEYFSFYRITRHKKKQILLIIIYCDPKKHNKKEDNEPKIDKIKVFFIHMTAEFLMKVMPD